jgi:hypothetical protein
MLRNPVDRVASLYHYVKREPKHRHHELVQSVSLIEYVVSGINPETSNGMTRRLGP